MSNQETIKELSALMTRQPDYAVALDKAISALQAQDVSDTNVGDMVSRQTAINTVKKHYRVDNDLLEVIVHQLENLPPAQPEPLVNESRTLVNDLVNDTISRQAAIDALKEKRNSAKEWYEEASASGDEMMLSRAESAMMTFVECILTIKKLPSVQPEIIHCRDCKHSMNNENGNPWICAHPNNNAWNITPDHYCGYAERRTDDANDIT